MGLTGDSGHLVTANTLSFVSGVAVSVTSLYINLAETLAEA
jgi:hypothetical protein